MTLFLGMRPYPFISRIRCTRLSDYFAYPLYKTIRLFRVSVVQDYPIISRIRCTCQWNSRLINILFLGMHQVSKRLMYNDERQLGAMLTLETDRILSKVNSAKSVGHESYNTRSVGCESFQSGTGAFPFSGYES